MAQLPALNEAQVKKLKVLSIATLSETQQVYQVVVVIFGSNILLDAFL